ncbi:HAMP domain-containing sensor histidine kinase [Actinomycetospora cinnamomea]|uniref:histidine kinase n=1 Tax=Actinomycetospora cinnamomea TaxID=663609 RepID=A0A2U1FS94_9PSEU|nr:HAMP domain-containing sensor histidine kinase [Actinomycetospora cinnamomea]PVZ14982.1 two-component system sensor histidine kinase MprB [Actinomycetospora cinnamomea]
MERSLPGPTTGAPAAAEPDDGHAAAPPPDDKDGRPVPGPPDDEPPPGLVRHVLQGIPLRRRVGILVSVGGGLLVALIAVAVYLTAQRALYDQLDESLVQRATVAASGDLADPALLLRVSQDALAAGEVRVAIVTAGGEAVTIAGNSPPLGAPEVAAARRDPATSVRTGVVDGQLHRVVAVYAGEGRALVLAQELDPTRRTLSKLAVVLLVTGASGVLLAALTGVAIARAGLRPVERLISATARVARTGDLRPIPVTGGDEIARLTSSFNAMLAALASSIERQRRLVADAGHELRTPLTSLRTNLELLMASEQASSHPDAPRLSDEDRAELQADLRAQVDELATLVGDVVELARDDPPEVAAEPLDLADVVERALDRARRRAAAENVTFDVDLASCEVTGDANALERAALNLLDNAAKWSPPGGRVRVTLRHGVAPERPGTAVLEVADAGPGIADEELDLVFERFYRSLDARTMSGSGLGLSIVAQVAGRHHGGVSAGRAPEGGALLRFWIPRR